MKKNKKVPFSAKHFRKLAVLGLASSLLTTQVLAIETPILQKSMSEYASKELLNDPELKNVKESYMKIFETKNKIENYTKEINNNNNNKIKKDMATFYRDEMRIYLEQSLKVLEERKFQLPPQLREMLDPAFQEYERQTGISSKGKPNKLGFQKALSNYALFKLGQNPETKAIKEIYDKITDYRAKIENYTKEINDNKNNKVKKDMARLYRNETRIYLEQSLEILEERKSSLSYELKETFDPAFREYEKLAEFSSIERMKITEIPTDALIRHTKAPEAPSKRNLLQIENTPETPSKRNLLQIENTPETPSKRNLLQIKNVPENSIVESIIEKEKVADDLLKKISSEATVTEHKIENSSLATQSADKKIVSDMANVLEARKQVATLESELSVQEKKSLADSRKELNLDNKMDEKVFQEMESVVENDNKTKSATSNLTWKNTHQRIKDILKKVSSFFKNSSFQTKPLKKEVSLSALQAENIVRNKVVNPVEQNKSIKQNKNSKMKMYKEKLVKIFKA